MSNSLSEKFFLLFILVSNCGVAFAQEKSVDKLDSKYLNWYNRDPHADHVLGIGVDKSYKELLAQKTPKKTVIVAVIDGGVDITHEDLKEQIWVNEDEIPGNGIDDDNNGYIDDVHGWNFIGNKNGENLLDENFEITRLVAVGNGPYYDQARKLYDERLAQQLKERENILKFEAIYLDAKSTIKSKTGIDVTTIRDMDAIGPDDGEQVLKAKRFLVSRYEQGFSERSLLNYKQRNQDYLEKYLNKNLNARAVVGDDPTDINSVGYGNPDVKGPRANHGTSVAGVIAARRNNQFGIDGIATNVKIMCLRSTPNGDERDKDVALAIRYAVDNGAEIINMSFGKPLSPQKKFVDDAVRYAEEKDVLLVHGSGNDGKDIDETESYPSDRYLNGVEASNWLNVGASGSVDNDEVAASFSNYGKKHVDIFAPGQNIISTDSSSTYSMNDGTSLAAPVVSGVAALILTYYPELTSKQLISILLESSYQVDRKVVEPGQPHGNSRKVKFASLSKSGGIVNAYAP